MKKLIMVSMISLISLVSCTKSDDLISDKIASTSSSPCKKSTSSQCLGMTKSGTRCQNKTLSCNGYCYLHGGN